MKINPKLKFISLYKKLPPLGAHVLFLIPNSLDGDYWEVGAVCNAFYCTEVNKRSTFKNGVYSSSYSVRETQKRINSKSYPYVILNNDKRVTEGKFIVLAQ